MARNLARCRTDRARTLQWSEWEDTYIFCNIYMRDQMLAAGRVEWHKRTPTLAMLSTFLMVLSTTCSAQAPSAHDVELWQPTDLMLAIVDNDVDRVRPLPRAYEACGPARST